MSFESAKKHGFIASILVISIYIAAFAISLSFIPLIGQIATNPLETTPPMENYLIGTYAATLYILIAGLIALILFLLAQYRLSKYYKEPAIFRNILYSIIATIIYTVIVTIVSIIFALTVFTTTIINNLQIMQNSLQPDVFANSFLIFIVALIITAIPVAIINGILWWRAFTKLGKKSGIEKFETTGLLFFIGSFIGIVNLIAWIFAATCYKQLQPQPTPSTPSNTTSTDDKTYCKFCGAENNANDAYCKHCGNTLQIIQTNP